LKVLRKETVVFVDSNHPNLIMEKIKHFESSYFVESLQIIKKKLNGHYILEKNLGYDM